MYEALLSQASKSIKWAGLAQIIGRFSQPLLLLILARVLRPAEYGILEIAVLVAALSAILLDMGLSRALVQTDSDPQSAANAVFWLNFGFGAALYGLLFLGSPTIAAFFREPELIAVLRISGLQVPLLSLAVVQSGLAQRELRYERQFLALSASALVMVALTLGLTSAGQGLWAFVWGSLAGAAAQVLAYWLTNPWLPSLRRIDRSLAQRLLGFGAFAGLEVLAGWAFNYGDNVIVGRFLGVDELGTYALAFNVAVFSIALVMNPIISISFASLSRLAHAPLQLRRTFLSLTRVVALLVIPMGIGLCLLADPVAAVAFQGRWPGVAGLIRILSISPGLMYVVSINSELYRAANRPDIMPKVLLTAIAYGLGAYLIAVSFGLTAFAVARASVGILFLPVHVLILRRTMEISAHQLWSSIRPAILGTIPMAGAVLIAGTLTVDLTGALAWLRILLPAALGVVVYLFALRWIDRQSIATGWKLIRMAIG